MTKFLRLKLAGSERVSRDCLVNVHHIQHIRPLAKGVRIYWGTAMAGEDGSYVDQDDYQESLNEIMEKLRRLQVEWL